MELDYDGPAELIDEHGNVVEAVIAHLTGGAASWGGHVQATLFVGPDWADIVRIRLEDGTEADVALKEVTAWTAEDLQAGEEANLRTATVTGSGPPPF